ncbi:DUF5984 family protein [Micromonospora krabiensis]|uniref:Uncharacterized protein n=1 Tax=Micromonospora krabiensis TaxID=307121 RepID=A0A1C3MWE1_9ACTN|nr:DUF5984 family protein [Micromonospora krabiensis]SBV24643.1 hypothetical protein GA0070620_0067 [Micromonospora krabiensis]
MAEAANAPRIRFRFELRPLAQVHPWGRERRTLHWFGLTDGWYWIELNGHELLRYSDQTVRRRQTDGYEGMPYADYYVVRLWEDLLQLLPAVLEPVPTDLVPFVEADSTSWAERGEHEEDFTAEIWYGDRVLDVGYLRNAPVIRWWRTIINGADAVTVDWWNRRCEKDLDVTFADPVRGRLVLTTEELIDAVRDLDRDLMAAMHERITLLEERHVVLPDVELDLAALRAEHHDRATWLRHALDRRVQSDWTAIRAGAALLRRSS